MLVILTVSFAYSGGTDIPSSEIETLSNSSSSEVLRSSALSGFADNSVFANLALKSDTLAGLFVDGKDLNSDTFELLVAGSEIFFFF